MKNGIVLRLDAVVSGKYLVCHPRRRNLCKKRWLIVSLLCLSVFLLVEGREKRVVDNFTGAVELSSVNSGVS